MSLLFGTKYPKAAKARETKYTKETSKQEESSKVQSSTQGAYGPLLGELGDPEGHPSVDPVAQRPSKATGGASEERGSCTRDKTKAQNRALKALGMRYPDQTERRGVVERSGRTKKKTGNTTRKGVNDIRKWFEARGKPQEES